MAKVALVQEPVVEDEESAPPRRKSKLIPILGVLVLLGGGGGAAWYFLGHKGGDHAAEKAVAEAPPIFLPIDQFTTNLNPEGGEQFLQAAFTLRVTDLEVVEAVKLRLPDVRNRILLLLSSKKAAELATVEGKQKLSVEIAQVTNEAIAPSFPMAAPAKKAADSKKGADAKAAEPAKSGHMVTGVLITNFIIQ
jgi:flagellar protein FliL